MNLPRTVPRLFGLYAAGFVLVLGQLGYWKLARAEEFASHPRNPRFQAAQQAIQRGRVVTADGADVALSEVVERDPRGLRPPRFRRVWPRGDLFAHITGYSSPIHGATALERNLDRWLSGRAAPTAPRDLWDLLEPPPVVGDDVHLTIRADLQQIAARELGARRGAIVALDVRTGAILALVDWPRYDPNGADDRWSALLADPNKPLLARAYQGLYPPGSVFKVLTAAGALDAGVVTPDTPFTTRGVHRYSHSTVRDYRFLGDLTLSTAISKSSNIALSQVALKLGPAGFESLCERAGLESAAALFAPGEDYDRLVKGGAFPRGEKLTPQMLAACGYGQGALALTPLHVAGIGQILGSLGERREPYLIERIVAPSGQVRYRHQPAPGRRVVAASSARSVLKMMEAVLSPGGTASHLRVRGLRLGGKTGSAENPHGRPHSWFLAVGPVDAPRVAVAALVENGGRGGTVAGPAAMAVLRAAL